jgi:hypothetical protein
MLSDWNMLQKGRLALPLPQHIHLSGPLQELDEINGHICNGSNVSVVHMPFVTLEHMSDESCNGLVVVEVNTLLEHFDGYSLGGTEHIMRLF